MEPTAPAIVSKKNISFGLKIFLWIIIFLLLIYGLFFFFLLRGIKMSEVKLLISKASKNYENPVAVEKILLQGVEEIKSSKNAIEQARAYAKATGISIEQVLVDNAVAMAKNYGYIN